MVKVQREVRLQSAATAFLREFEAAGRCPTGAPVLDRALNGGFARGAVHELVAPAESAPARTLSLMAAARTVLPQSHRQNPVQPQNGNEENREGDWIFYIDTARDFYPPAAARLGVPLDRLIVIHAFGQADVLWVCEQALRCKAVAAVVATLRRLDAYASRRLQLAAETGGTLGLLIRTEDRPGHTFAATRVRFDPLPPALQDRETDEWETRRIQVTVLKLREGRPAEPFVMELHDAAGVVHSPAVPGDRPGETAVRAIG